MYLNHWKFSTHVNNDLDITSTNKVITLKNCAFHEKFLAHNEMYHHSDKSRIKNDLFEKNFKNILFKGRTNYKQLIKFGL